MHLFKDDVASGRQRVTCAFLDAVVAWRWVNGHDRCLTCLGSKHAEVAFVDESSSHCGCSSRSCGQAPLPRQRGGAVI